MINTNKRSSLFLSLFLGTALISSPIFASDFSPSQQGDRVPIGERSVMENENSQSKLQNPVVSLESQKNKEDEEFSKALSSANYYTTHPGCFQTAVAISYSGDVIELRDGSMWAVYSNDRYKTLSWLTSDQIIITPNDEWLSAFDYKLFNLATGDKVKVNISLGPIYNGVYTNYIVGIDYANGQVLLQDGSIWHLSSDSDLTYLSWLPNDRVIIGVNYGVDQEWFETWYLAPYYYQNMLINVNTNQRIFARCHSVRVKTGY